MGISTMITVDSRSVEHLDLEDGFLSFLTGYVLKHYGEQIAWKKHPSDQSFFVALYFFDDLTWISSKLVNPEFFKNQKGIYVHDEDEENEEDFDEEFEDNDYDVELDEEVEEDESFEYTSDEPYVHNEVVISALVSTQFVSDPVFVGYVTHVLFDSHFEDLINNNGVN